MNINRDDTTPIMNNNNLINNNQDPSVSELLSSTFEMNNQQSCPSILRKRKLMEISEAIIPKPL